MLSLIKNAVSHGSSFQNANFCLRYFKLSSSASNGNVYGGIQHWPQNKNRGETGIFPTRLKSGTRLHESEYVATDTFALLRWHIVLGNTERTANAS